MSVQNNRARIHPKNLCGAWMQQPFRGQIRNAYVSFIVGINGDEVTLARTGRSRKGHLSAHECPPRVRIAEWVLELVTAHERAASTVGDLRESAATRGEAWFWSSVLRTMGSLLWRGIIAEPRMMLWLALRAWLVGLGLCLGGLPA